MALIVGAGVAGLSAAWWLERIGWRSIVVERAGDLRAGGYMLGLSGPGYETAQRMGMLPALERAAYTINENVYRDRRGRELLRLRYRDVLRGLPYLAIRRTDLVRTLHEGVSPATELRLATTVVGIAESEAGVSVDLSDGSRIVADFVIAAEGFRSQIRQRLFGPDRPHLAPLGYRFAIYDLDDPLHLEADFLSYAEPGHLAEYYALGHGRLAAMHVWRDLDADPVPEEERWTLLERVAARSHPTVRDLMSAARRGPPPIIDGLTLVDPPTWSKGRILLLGDAAHCLTLVSGQGAGIAMTSAEMLSQELGRTTIPDALGAHERRLRPAIARLQQRSRRMAAVFIPESTLAFHLRNLVLRHMPRAWLGRYLANAVRSEIALVQDAV